MAAEPRGHACCEGYSRAAGGGRGTQKAAYIVTQSNYRFYFIASIGQRGNGRTSTSLSFLPHSHDLFPNACSGKNKLEGNKNSCPPPHYLLHHRKG